MEVGSPTPGMGIAISDHLMVVLFRRSPTAATLQLRLPYIDRVRKRSPGGLSVVIIVDRAAAGDLPNAKSREETKRQMKEFESDIISVAMVLERNEVRFALLRTLLRAVTIAAGGRYPRRFFGEVEDAHTCCNEQHRDALPTAPALEINQAAEQLRKITPF